MKKIIFAIAVLLYGSTVVLAQTPGDSARRQTTPQRMRDSTRSNNNIRYRDQSPHYQTDSMQRNKPVKRDTAKYIDDRKPASPDSIR